jgi:quinolinate synthase
MDILRRIADLRRQRNAVILVHNYQLPEAQDIADHVGDSLELARISSQIAAQVIVFCGVHFMAETAKLFNPDKTVLMPDLHAGCPMANMIYPEKLLRLKRDHPDAGIVTYVNSTAEIKAQSDICCTSANGVAVASALAQKEIIFVPDKYLGSYVARRLPRKTFHLADGYCPTHMLFTREELTRLKEANPGARVVVHPECRVEVQECADAVCSTSQMIKYARTDQARRFIIGTEIGMLYRLKKEVPDKDFIPGNPNALCPNMKLTTLEKVCWSLEHLDYEVTVDPGFRDRARAALDRMLQINT